MTDFREQLDHVMPTALVGSVVRTEGVTAAVAGFPAPVGALVEIERQAGETVTGEVIGFRENVTLVFPHGEIAGVRHGNRVRMSRTARFLRVGEPLLGRIVNAYGRPVDGMPHPALPHRAMLHRRPPAAVDRPQIREPLSTGVRVIDGLLTCGRGQRMGIFSGSGVGKSVMLGMMAHHTSADVNVIALIGERGRELNEFIHRDLGQSGLRRSVVVVATSNEPALLRVQAALSATAIAEYFRDQGKDVLLLMDSVTRFAMAQREIGLAAGEPPTTRGYPPSVFGVLPRLVERAGRSPHGSITAFYSVLVEGDDVNEPISDTVRGLLDGHTVLSRKIASRGRYPAVDVLESLSRLMPDLVDPRQRAAAQHIRSLLAIYRDHEDLITVGAYRPGANPTLDVAVTMNQEIESHLGQSMDESSSVETAREELLRLAARCVVAQSGAAEPNAAGRSPAADTSPNKVSP